MNVFYGFIWLNLRPVCISWASGCVWNSEVATRFCMNKVRTLEEIETQWIRWNPYSLWCDVLLLLCPYIDTRGRVWRRLGEFHFPWNLHVWLLLCRTGKRCRCCRNLFLFLCKDYSFIFKVNLVTYRFDEYKLGHAYCRNYLTADL
jgi:hypothetical protein